MEEIKINEKFKPLVENKECRYFILTGGRGSSKSFTTTLINTTETFKPNNRTLFTRYTMASAHLSIIPEYLEKIELLNLDKYFLFLYFVRHLEEHKKYFSETFL